MVLRHWSSTWRELGEHLERTWRALGEHLESTGVPKLSTSASKLSASASKFVPSESVGGPSWRQASLLGDQVGAKRVRSGKLYVLLQ